MLKQEHYLYSIFLKCEGDKNLSFVHIQYHCRSLINLVKDCTAVKSDILRNKGNVMKRGRPRQD